MNKYKRIIAAVMCIVTLCTVALAGCSNGGKDNSQQTTINISKEHQTMNGFGASGCWWSKDVGGWDNLDDIMVLLYDEYDGIGLNIYRYNLGADSINDELTYRNDRYTEGFINADGTFDFSRDANSQKALASAKRFAGDDLRVTLFCNSAPIYMTKNGMGIANDYWWDQNLDDEYFDAFAKYGYECVKFFQQQGYRITDISPVNEPFGHWCRESEEVKDENGETVTNENGDPIINYFDTAGQEGSFYFREGVRDIANAFIKQFEGTEVAERGCKVSILEANDMANNEGSLEVYLRALFGKGKDFRGANKEIRKNIDTISMHSYFSTLEGKIQTADYINKKYKGLKVAQTEYCQMDIDDCNGLSELYEKEGMTSGLGIDYGIALANIMYDDLTVFDAVEWDWWTAVAYGGYTDGLVYVDKDTHEIQTSKRLYTLGNFSKFTGEGSIRIDASCCVDGLKSIAFKNDDGSLSIIFINNTTDDKQTSLNIKGNKKVAFTYNTYVTDEERSLAPFEAGSSTDDMLTIPQRSITTVLLKPNN